jgi:ATP-binding cassette subfamily F protein uup
MAPRPPIVALKDVRLADGPVMLFDGVDLTIEPRARACLVGRNGAGKSTLMKVLAGGVIPDGGDRFIQPGLRSAFVPQEPEILGDTVLDYATAGGAQPWEAESELEAFGLDPAKSTTGLSGGEIRRAALARAFAEAPDLIMLDEPTNHLDIFAIELLERRLKDTKAAVLVVSHDRRFLERVTTRCFWLAHRKIRTLDKGYVAFEEWADKVEAEEQENLRRLTKAIERETYTFYRSITAQRTRNEGRARALDAMRLQRAAIMKDVARPLELELDAGGVSGRLVAEAKGIAKSFGERVIVSGFSTRILRGDRVAIVGPNGAGKTTLVKLLLGELAIDEGGVRLGTGLDVVYLDQGRADLTGEMTLWEALTPSGGDSIVVRGVPRHVAAYAKDFLFKDSQLRQPVSTLSGGERNRLLLARALARPANLLVLDEPTNDLDMETLDLLEELLADYEGTLILVSHDRDFIDRLATSTIALDGRGRVVETPGGWTDLLRQNPEFFEGGGPSPLTLPSPRGERGANPSSRPAMRGEGGTRELSEREGEGSKKPAKLTFKDQRRLEEAERETHDLPSTIARLEARLGDPGLYTRDPKAFAAISAELDAARAKLEKAELDWLELEAKREALVSGG